VKQWFLIALLPVLLASCASLRSKGGKNVAGMLELNSGPNYDGVQLEKLGRGLVAVHQGKGVVTIAWRKCSGDAPKTTFSLYRRTYTRGVAFPKEVRLTETPLNGATYFTDRFVDTTLIQEYLLRDSKTGKKGSVSYRLTPELAKKHYLGIPLRPIEGDSTWMYRPNDASVGDLDGDGEYEIVVKRQIGNLDCRQKGLSGGTLRLEAYRLSGENLWSMNLGVNLREGAPYFSFVVYDMDGDGKAEVVCKTAEGTVFGDGSRIGDTNNDGITDYVVRDSTQRTFGKILSGPEFLSVVDGLTGKERARAPYITRGNPLDWGDDAGVQVDRQLLALAFLDGKRPSVVATRGIGSRTVAEAWDFRNDQLTKRWSFDTKANNFKYIAWSNQGNPNLRVGDIDFDGKDEIVYGACTIDDNGAGLYSTGLGGGASVHLADIDPEKSGLEVLQSHFYAPNPNSTTLSSASTGKLLVGLPSSVATDRCLYGDIDPNHKGMEIWSTQSNGVFSCKGKRISAKTPSTTLTLWWDGDKSRELLDKFYIDKWTGNGTVRLFDGKGKGLAWCNGPQGTPCLVADILGDWREEVLWPSADGKELRLYLTNEPTSLGLTTFMHDPMYRTGVANENAGNNQSPETSYYVGTDPINLRKWLLKRQ
jgi:rhamnogalacturonan endolyase